MNIITSTLWLKDYLIEKLEKHEEAVLLVIIGVWGFMYLTGVFHD